MALLTAINLADHADLITGVCYPSLSLLGDKMGIQKRAVSDHIKTLKKLKVIKVGVNMGKNNVFNQANANRYVFNIEKLRKECLPFRAELKGKYSRGVQEKVGMQKQVPMQEDAEGDVVLRKRVVSKTASKTPSETPSETTISSSNIKALSSTDVGSSAKQESSAPPAPDSQVCETPSGCTTINEHTYVALDPKTDEPVDSTPTLAPAKHKLDMKVYLKIWWDQYKGKFPVKNHCKAFKEAEKEFGPRSTQLGFKHYCWSHPKDARFGPIGFFRCVGNMIDEGRKKAGWDDNVPQKGE